MNGISIVANSDSRGTVLSSAELRSRLRWLWLVFVVLVITIYGRLIALEVRDGAEYREMASEPSIRSISTPGRRGRILARDGTVLAYDDALVDLAVNYRWLEEPANARWLRQTARARLSAAERRDARRVTEEEQIVLAQRRDLHNRLAALCGLSDEEWQTRARQIQQRVETLAAKVNARHELARGAGSVALDDDPDNMDSVAKLASLVGRSITEALFASGEATDSGNISVAEETADHVIYSGLPLEAVAEIETHPQNYPGAKLNHSYQRVYPEGSLAANVVGYLGLASPEEIGTNADHTIGETNDQSYRADDWVGRSGVERQYESLLRGQRGLTHEECDARGRVVHSTVLREPAAGQDVVLSIDPAIQRTAQALLDEAVARRLPSGDDQVDRTAGGAVVALDVQTGAVLAAATAPRFDPNGFVQKDREQVAQWLHDPAHPLLDRCVQMALAPGSVFKIVSAAALLSAGVDADAALDCQGYLHQPDSLRCAVYRRYGVGHGLVTMVEALARSCNVYFFHYAEQLGAAPLVDWARRLGLGRATGVDLPGEVAGTVTRRAKTDSGGEVTDSSAGDNSGLPVEMMSQEQLMISIGQGPMTATPLQVVRMVAAITNGGKLVTPHVAVRTGTTEKQIEIAEAPPRAIEGLSASMLAVIRKGLRQTVADEQGTAHAVIEYDPVAIAGKTGTAETGASLAEHAWFAGYAPADNPRVAFVVVIEHAGNSGPVTGPVVQYLVQRMDELGYFSAKVAASSAREREPLAK